MHIMRETSCPFLHRSHLRFLVESTCLWLNALMSQKVRSIAKSISGKWFPTLYCHKRTLILFHNPCNELQWKRVISGLHSLHHLDFVGKSYEELHREVQNVEFFAMMIY